MLFKSFVHAASGAAEVILLRSSVKRVHRDVTTLANEPSVSLAHVGDDICWDARAADFASFAAATILRLPSDRTPSYALSWPDECRVQIKNKLLSDIAAARPTV